MRCTVLLMLAAWATLAVASGCGDADGDACGYHDLGVRLEVAPDVELCVPSVVCTAETCPPPLGTCVDGSCVFDEGYSGLARCFRAGG